MASDIGINGQMFVDARDISTLLSAFRYSLVQGSVDNTRLRAPGRYRTHAVTLNGGSLGFTGDLPDDDAEALVHLHQHLEHQEGPHIITQAPFGADVGNLVHFGKALHTTCELGTEIEAVLSLNAEFEITAGSHGITPGLCLFSPNADGTSLSQNEITDLVFTNADPNQFFGLRAVGTADVFSFQAAVTNPQLKAGVEGLPAYAGRTTTVTGNALIGTTLKSGSKRIEFDGATNVPALEVVQGALHTLTLNNATSAKTIYGNITVDPTVSSGAGTAASTVQTAVRAKGGDYANGVVSKSGSGGNAVYTFAFPVGANPPALVAPTVTTPAGPVGTNLLAAQTLNSFTGTQYTDLTDGNTASIARPLGNGEPWYSYTPSSSVVVTRVRVYLTSVAGGDLKLSLSNGYGQASFELANATPEEPTLKTIPADSPAGWYDLVLATPHTFGPSTPLVVSAYTAVNSELREIDAYATADTQGATIGPDPTTNVFVAGSGDATTVDPLLIQEGGQWTGVNIVSSPISGPILRDYLITQPTTKGMFVCLQSLLVTMGTSTWKIRHAPDNSGSPGTFVDLLTFDVVNGAGAQTQEVPVDVPIYPHLRAQCSAITGNAQVVISVARHF